MFDNLAELNHLVVGPVRNKSLLFGGRNMFQRGDFRRRVVHCEPFPVDFSSVPEGNVFHPFDSTVRDLKFDVVYRLFKENPETDEITFSVRLPDRKVVIW